MPRDLALFRQLRKLRERLNLKDLRINTIRGRKLYEHDCLDTAQIHIRLLRIHPTSAKEKLSISIQTFELNSAPTYTALSYAWGEDKPSHPICVCDEEIGYGVLYVSRNLLDFLTMASEKFERLEERWFWIDQISIDQKHTSERNHQVLHMENIFSQAELVLIWLGPSFEGSSELIADIQSFDAPEAAFVDSDLKALDDQTCGFDELLGRNLEQRLGPFKPSRAMTEQFANLPWWSRVWVCQEIVLARRLFVFIGQDYFLWDTVYWFRWLNKAIRHIPLDGLLHANYLMMQRQNRRTKSLHQETWSNVIFLSMYRECSVPEDKFYGMLGLVQPILRIPVDYNLSLDEIFLAVLRRDFFCPDHEDYRCDHVELSQALQLFASRIKEVWEIAERAIRRPILSRNCMSKFILDEFMDLRFPGPRNEGRLQSIIDTNHLESIIESCLDVSYYGEKDSSQPRELGWYRGRGYVPVYASQDIEAV